MKGFALDRTVLEEQLRTSLVNTASSAQKLGLVEGASSTLVLFREILRNTSRPEGLSEAQWKRLKGKLFEELQKRVFALLDKQEEVPVEEKDSSDGNF